VWRVLLVRVEGEAGKMLFYCIAGGGGGGGGNPQMD